MFLNVDKTKESAMDFHKQDSDNPSLISSGSE